MEVKLAGKLSRQELIHLTVSVYIRRRSVYYLKVVGAALLVTTVLILKTFGSTRTSLFYILSLTGILLALHLIRLLFGVARIYRATKESEHETQLILTPDTVTMETPGRGRIELPIKMLSIRKERQGLLGLAEGSVLFFVPYRALMAQDRANLNAMYGLALPE